MTRWLRRMTAQEKLHWWDVAAGPLDSAVAAWERETALAAAARQGGDVKQAPAESPQSGGRKPVTPEPYEPWDHPSSPSHIPLMNKDEAK